MSRPFVFFFQVSSIHKPSITRQDAVVLFLKRIIQDECGELDGSTPVHLRYTIQEYYHQYKSSHTQDLHVTYKVFRITWLNTFPQVKSKIGVVSDTVTKYLNNLAEECGTREESNDGNIYLPYKTKREVYQLYDSVYGSDAHVTEDRFHKIWRDACPHVKVKTPRDYAVVLFLKRIIQDECDELDGSTTVHLQYTIDEYYHQYISSHTKDLHVTFRVFGITWLNTFPHVKGKMGVLSDTVTQYINNLAEEREESNDGNIYLPHRTKREVYQLYDSKNGSEGEFSDIWSDVCPHVKVKGNEVPKDILIQFMSDLLEKYGHKTSTEDKGAIYLPYSSKMELYRLYQSTFSAEKRVSQRSFYRIWNDVFPCVKLNGNTVVNFLSTLVDQEGRECENGSGDIDLPYSSKKEVYNLYLASEESDPDVSLRLFSFDWLKIFPHVRTRHHKTQQNFIQFFNELVDERVSTQKVDSEMVYLDFETPRTLYEQYVHGNSDCVLSYQEFLDTWKSSFPHVMTLAEKCPHIRRNITQFISKSHRR